MDDFVSIVNEEKQVDGMLGTWLSAIAYSTMRGIILQETQNTLLKGIIIPVVDPKRLLTEENESSKQQA